MSDTRDLFGWITGRSSDYDGSGAQFQVDKGIGDQPTQFITLNEAVDAFLLTEVRYLMNPTNAETYQLFLLEKNATDAEELQARMVFDSGALRADNQRYIDNLAGGKLPMLCELETPGRLWLATDWTGAPGSTPGYVEVRGRKIP